MTCMQPNKVDEEWKPEYVYTVIFGKTNQIKWNELPGRIKEFQPPSLNLFSISKGNISVCAYVFEHPMSLQCFQHDKRLVF